MRKFLLATSLVAAIAVAGCASGTTAPTGPSASADPSASPTQPSATPPATATPDPTLAPPAVTPPAATPRPTTRPPEATNPPAPVEPTANEQYLLNGVHRGAVDCAPVRSDLPARAVAGIECDADRATIARVGFYLFENDADMLAVYFARMAAEGVETNSGGCYEGEGESGYIPSPDDMGPARVGCFLNDHGIANYRGTLPGEHVYFGILGRTADFREVSDFAWVGNQDVPGTPTLWGMPID